MIRGTNSLFTVHYLLSFLVTRCHSLFSQSIVSGGLVFPPFCFSLVIPAKAGIYTLLQETKKPGNQDYQETMIPSHYSLFTVYYLSSLLTTAHYTSSLQSKVYGLKSWMPAFAGMTRGLVAYLSCFSFVIPAKAGIHPLTTIYSLLTTFSLLTVHYLLFTISPVYSLKSTVYSLPTYIPRPGYF